MKQKNIDKTSSDISFIEEIKKIVRSARGKAYTAINYAQVEQNWLIGKRIVEQEQNGAERAEYGAYILHTLSEILTAEFGQGFSIRNLKNFRRFYLEYRTASIGQTLSAQLQDTSNQLLVSESQILQTLSAILPWSHYERLFATKYKLILPKPEELQEEIQRQAEIIKTQLLEKK